MKKKEIVKLESETVKISNKFFSKIIKNFGFPVYDGFDLGIENLKNLIFKATYKTKIQSILAIKDTRKNIIFYFLRKIEKMC